MDVAFASARDRLGQTLCGKYHLDEVIGVGGTAVVYRATHRNGHRVAVKMLHDYLCKSREVSRRFMREGYLANMLDHPGTVRVLDDDATSEGIAFLVLELLEGETLEDRRIRLGGTMTVDEVLGIADQLLAVLEVAHARHVVHRDIKPSNLFVMRDGTLKVLDFGIARLVDDSGGATATKTGQMIGTPAFMPPEQALSRPRDIDAQSDLWAVGATMFTLLSGELVHVAESTSEHLVKAATLEARSVARVLPGVPSNVEALVARALAFHKSGRWTSASEMRREVWRVRLDPGVPVPHASAPPTRRSITSSYPTVIGKRDSGGLEKTAMTLPPVAPSKRRMLLPTGAAAALVLGVLGIAVYGTMARANGLDRTASAATAERGERSPVTITGAAGAGAGGAAVATPTVTDPAVAAASPSPSASVASSASSPSTAKAPAAPATGVAAVAAVAAARPPSAPSKPAASPVVASPSPAAPVAHKAAPAKPAPAAGNADLYRPF